MTKLIENAPKVLALLSFAFLSLTILHEFGYFWRIGSHFQALLTTYDYFANAPLWFPYSAVILIYSEIIRNNVWEEPSKRTGIDFGKAYWIQIVFFFLLAVATELFSEYRWNFFDFVPIALMSAIPMALVIPYNKFQYGFSAYKALITTPLVIILAFAYGLSSARSDIRNTSNIYRLNFKEGEPKHFVMLRILEKGVLVRDTLNNRIEFYRWDGLLSLSKIAILKKSEPSACYWFGIRCYETPQL